MKKNPNNQPIAGNLPGYAARTTPGVWVDRGSVVRQRMPPRCARSATNNLIDPSGRVGVEFCSEHLGMSHTHANRLIGYLDEFGLAYFEMAQFTGI